MKLDKTKKTWLFFIVLAVLLYYGGKGYLGRTAEVLPGMVVYGGTEFYPVHSGGGSSGASVSDVSAVFSNSVRLRFDEDSSNLVVTSEMFDFESLESVRLSFDLNGGSTSGDCWNAGGNARASVVTDVGSKEFITSGSAVKSANVLIVYDDGMIVVSDITLGRVLARVNVTDLSSVKVQFDLSSSGRHSCNGGSVSGSASVVLYTAEKNYIGEAPVFIKEEVSENAGLVFVEKTEGECGKESYCIDYTYKLDQLVPSYKIAGVLNVGYDIDASGTPKYETGVASVTATINGEQVFHDDVIGYAPDHVPAYCGNQNDGLTEFGECQDIESVNVPFTFEGVDQNVVLHFTLREKDGTNSRITEDPVLSNLIITYSGRVVPGSNESSQSGNVSGGEPEEPAILLAQEGEECTVDDDCAGSLVCDDNVCTKPIILQGEKSTTGLYVVGILVLIALLLYNKKYQLHKPGKFKSWIRVNKEGATFGAAAGLIFAYLYYYVGPTSVVSLLAFPITLAGMDGSVLAGFVINILAYMFIGVILDSMWKPNK